MTLLAGRYRVEGPAGQGGGARTFLMRDQWDGGRPVLTKVLRPDEEAADLAREFALLFRVRHPHVARALELGRLTEPFAEAGAPVGALYFVQELCPGAPAATHAPLAPAAALVVCAQLAAALAALHACGIAHGDLKPDNVVLDGDDPARLHARLIDFGLAHRGRAAVGGTLGYLAPEAMAGRGGPEADLFGLGATLVHLLSGEAPRPGAPLASPLHADLVAQLTAADPARRLDARAAFEVLLAALPEALRPRLEARRDDSTPGSGLFGRDDVVRELDAALAPPIVSTRVLRLRGAPGSGRTALLEEAVVRGAWRGLLAPGSVRASQGGDLSVVDRVLRELGAGAESAPPPPLDAHELTSARWRRLSELADKLTAATRRAPLLLAFDDVPDGSPLAELGELLERLGGRGPRLVWLQAQRGAGPSALAPLDEGAVRGMIAAARPLRPADADLAAAVATACGGVPARVVSLLRRFPGDRLRAAAHRGELGAGDDATLAALDGLSPAARDVALTLALLAGPTPVRALLDPAERDAAVGAAAAPPPALAAALAEAERAGLVVVRARGDGPVADVAGESARAALSRAAPDELVRRVLLRLEGEPAAHLADVGRLAHRLGDHERARPALRQAAREAVAALRLDEGIALFDLLLADTSLAASDRAGLAVESARLLLASGRLEAARQRFASAEHPESRVGEAEALVALGRFGDASELLLAPGAPEGEDAVAAGSIAARALLLAGSHDRAEAEARQALGAAAGHARAAELEGTLALVAFYRGDLAAARERGRAALERARVGSTPRILDACRANLALILQKSLEHDAAQALYDESLAAARARRDLPAELQRLSNLASLAQDRGQLGRALAAFDEAHALARVVDDRRALVRVGLNLANLSALVGDAGRARTHAHEASAVAEALGMASEAGYLALIACEVAIAQGDPAAAREHLARAREVLGRVGAKAALIEADIVEAELCVYARDLARAVELGSAAADVARAGGLPRLVAPALGWAALAALERHDPAAARLAAEFAAAADDRRDPDLAWLAHATSARALAQVGRGVDADLELARARALVTEVRSRLGPRLERAYGEVWYRREAWTYVSRAAPAQGPASALRDLDRLLAINRELAQDHDPERLLERIIDAAIALSGAERGFLVLKVDDGTSPALVIRAARNIDQDSIAQGDLEISRSLATQVIATGTPLSTVDAQGDERFRERLSVHRLNLRSVLCLPMRAQAGVLGALYLDNRQRIDAFSDADIALLTAFGDQAAIALANARMIEDLALRTRDLEHSRAAIEELNARLAKELEARAAELEIVRARTTDGGDGGRFGMVGTSAPMREVYRVVERVADKDVAVAILGESGTGKELVARAVHARSSRRGGAFVSVNSGAIPRELLESELFGHERGAFTGAVRTKPGLFEVAAGGTIFLDEIGDMPLEMQVKLLRVLQQKELRRVGGTVDIPTDVRVVSASNRDVPALVRAGVFREDLWYRLNVVEIRVPSLRARRDDLPLLVDHFLRRFGGAEPPRVRRDALALILDYDWPGNVRELENELQRALALADGAITEADLGPKVRAAAAMVKPTRARQGSLKDAVERYERDLLRRALDEHQGRVASVARALGMTRAGLYKKLHKYGFGVARS